MPTHEEVQAQIPAYAASRLEGEELRQVQVHLSECETCAEMAAGLERIVSALRREGEVLFEPHPPATTLRSYALGERMPEVERIERHVRLCARCDFEVAFWQRHRVTTAGRWKDGTSRRRLLTLVLAAGILLAVGLALLVRSLAPPGLGPAEARPLLVQLRQVRGSATRQHFKVGADHTHVALTVPADVGEAASGADRYRFEVRRVGGPVVGAREASARQIREDLNASAVFTLLIPAAKLKPGDYEVTLRPIDTPEKSPLMRIPFRVDVDGSGTNLSATPRKR